MPRTWVERTNDWCCLGCHFWFHSQESFQHYTIDNIGPYCDACTPKHPELLISK